MNAKGAKGRDLKSPLHRWGSARMGFAASLLVLVDE
jgi:hypothetical protein